MNQSEAKAQQPQRQSQVQEQVDRLESNLTTLHDSIGKLQDRLSIILRSSVQEEQAAEGKDRAELVVLATIIEGFVDSVQSANHKIEDLFERIEL